MVLNMLKSMTGYGRNEQLIDGKKILVEIKSVNHKYSDYNIKTPRYYSFLEEKIRQFLTGYISRGKVDVYISVENFENSDKDIALDASLAKEYIQALYSLRDNFNLKDDISVSSVARYTDIFKTERKEEDHNELWKSVMVVVKGASESFVEMRVREGDRMCIDMIERVDNMGAITNIIKERFPECIKEYRDRLYNKIKEVLSDNNVDEARIVTEVAIFADKIAIDEELVRLSSHFDEFHTIIKSNEPVGRRLDFLVQEINREINTIGSKANNLFISKRVVDLKAEVEKLREQIQNIE